MSTDSQYPLGSDPAELERLDRQGRMLAPPTRMLSSRPNAYPQ